MGFIKNMMMKRVPVAHGVYIQYNTPNVKRKGLLFNKYELVKSEFKNREDERSFAHNLFFKCPCCNQYTKDELARVFKESGYSIEPFIGSSYFPFIKEDIQKIVLFNRDKKHKSRRDQVIEAILTPVYVSDEGLGVFSSMIFYDELRAKCPFCENEYAIIYNINRYKNRYPNELKV